MIAFHHLRVTTRRRHCHRCAASDGERGHEQANGDYDRKERAEAHDRHMAPGASRSNLGAVNMQVDKPNGCPDAEGHESQRPHFTFAPDFRLVVARTFACGGAMARLVIP